MNRYRLQLGLCVWMALWTAAADSNAQSRKAESETATPLRRATDQKPVDQKKRSAGFLARRGIDLVPQRLSRGTAINRDASGAAKMLARARAEHHALALQVQASGGNTNLTAPWQPVGPAQVMTTTYGALTGRVSSIAVDSSDPSGRFSSRCPAPRFLLQESMRRRPRSTSALTLWGRQAPSRE